MTCIANSLYSTGSGPHVPGEISKHTPPTALKLSSEDSQRIGSYALQVWWWPVSCEKRNRGSGEALCANLVWVSTFYFRNSVTWLQVIRNGIPQVVSTVFPWVLVLRGTYYVVFFHRDTFRYNGLDFRKMSYCHAENIIVFTQIGFFLMHPGQYV